MTFSDRSAGLRTTVDLYPQLLGGNQPGLLNLGPGDPKVAMPPHVTLAVLESILEGRTGYTSTLGIPELRDAVAAYVKRHHGMTCSRENVFIGIGSKQILANTLLATVQAGDEVVLVTPYYTVYRQMVELAEGTAVVVESDPDAGFELPVEAIAAAITPRTKWIMLNTPQNPTGVVYPKEDLERLLEALEPYPDAKILDDHIYELLTFDGQVAPTSATLGLLGAERTVYVSGISKAYGMTGFRIGFAVAAPELVAMLGRLSYVMTSAPTTMSQYAALAALTGPDDVVERARSINRECAEVSVEVLSTEPRLTPLPPAAGLYCFVDCRGLMGTSTPDGHRIESDLDLVDYLAQQARVQLLPGTLFGSPGHVRVTFATAPTPLREGLQRLVGATRALR